jgi:hypothetical protein
VVDLADPRLVGAPADDGSSSAPPVVAELWRASTESATAPAPALDEATRQRLRELGYVE